MRTDALLLLLAALAAVPARAAADVRQEVAAAEKLADTDPAAALRRLDALAMETRGHAVRDMLDVASARCWLLAYTDPARDRPRGHAAGRSGLPRPALRARLPRLCL
jgi:hypothetical protein